MQGPQVSCFGFVIVGLLSIPAPGAAPPAPPVRPADEAFAAARFAEARDRYRNAVVESERRAGPKSEATLALRHRLGQAEWWVGDYAAAEKTLRPAYDDASKALGERHAVTARLANDLGVALYSLAKYAEARELFATALAARRKSLGDAHADTLQSLRNLAWAEEALGRPEESERLFGEAYSSLKSAFTAGRMAPPTSLEVLILLQSEPQFPKIKIAFMAAIWFEQPAEVSLERDIDRALAMERLGVLQRLAGRTGYEGEPPYAEQARALLVKLIGVADYRAVVARMNEQAPKRKGAENKDMMLRTMTATFGEKHPLTARLKANLAISLADGKNYDAARPLFAEALQATRERLGDEHPEVASVLISEGVLGHETGEIEPAVRNFERAAAIRQKALVPDHPDTATAWAALGVELYYRGDISRSRESLEKALAVRERVFGANSPQAADVRSDLAIVFREQGDYAKARQVLEEAVTILRETAGEEDFATQTAAANLCVVQMEMGDFQAAAAYCRKVIASDAPPQDKEQAYVNLAGLARAQGQPQVAAEYLEQAVALSPPEFVNPRLLNYLGATYRELGRFDEARSALTRSYEARLKSLGADHPDTAFALTSLGLLAEAEGKPAEAADRFRTALDIYHRQEGRTSLNTAEVASLLGTALLAADDAAGAEAALREALDLKLAIARDVLPTLSESESLAFLAKLGERDPLLEALRRRNAPAAEAYDVVWKTRALVTRAVAARRRLIPETPDARALADKLRLARMSLAEAVWKREDLGLLDDKRRADYQQQLLNLSREKERYERELAALSPVARQEAGLFEGTPANLAAKLPADVALVEFLKVRIRTPGKPQTTSGTEEKPTSDDRYEAFVVRHADGGGADIHRVALGAAAPIDAAVGDWRDRLKRAGGRGLKRVETRPGTPAGPGPAATVRRLAWEPIAEAMSGCTTALVVPDGELARVPFAALPSRDGSGYLVEEIGVATVSHGQWLDWLLDQPPAAEGGTLLVGGVSYDDAPDEKSAEVAVAAARGAAGATRGGWNYLPGTLEEVDRIAALAAGDEPKLRRLGGRDATRSAFYRLVPGSRYVHLATHGFFAEPNIPSPLSSHDAERMLRETPGFQQPDPRRPDGGDLQLPPVFVSLVGRNPLVLSGLVLAGANATAGAGAENQGSGGVVTAEEVVDLDLSGTELVVLSACETGLGTVAGGEGVFGLQRAFGLAGARATVASLWQVDDAATQALMVEFYKNLWQKRLGKLESLRRAQLAMLRGELHRPPTASDGDRLPPFYWAAFVLNGDWR